MTFEQGGGTEGTGKGPQDPESEREEPRVIPRCPGGARGTTPEKGHGKGVRSGEGSVTLAPGSGSERQLGDLQGDD